ncbi:NADPH:adrenodoxin oxidoreductase, mitochondrial [Colias croceus]|uniref:NADPH:adrenodoxin oxidoreductase, mitochondrial n=1 Tax=Colias crocea TaxID=72248 RepID=UPI001E280D3A|nr:NADPH:adrenodoxin oxidoreductase, mitochondrial [Colias croceus]
MFRTSMNKTVRFAVRQLCSTSHVPHVCVVGAGPAGFYAAMHLAKNINSIKIDIIEKLPVPFGLVRYGVAPDHPEVKNCINQFTKLAKQKNINFYGNITLGQDITLSKLRQHYDAILLTYGAEEDRTLSIENETARNIIAARNFVGWYNGHPRDKNLKVDLSGNKAAIIGQGNVALDVARILLSPIDQLKKTDITEYALQAISESKINELYLVGRRGPLQVAFTIKELREQLKLKNCQTIWRENDFIGVEDVVNNLQRPRKRLTELMLKSLKEQKSQTCSAHEKTFRPIFFRSPNKFLVNNGSVSGIELTCNKLVGDKLEDQKCVATEDKEILNCNLVFRSIGYKSIKADEALVFNSSGCVSNENGRVIEDHTTEELAKLYVAGWLGTGPAGVIIHTMSNAFQVAKNICSDLQTGTGSHRDGFDGVRKHLNIPIVDWNGWEKIDKYEVDQGKKSDKPREKVTCINKMLDIATK